MTGIIAARALGVEGRGYLAAILAWTSAVTYLGDLGLPLSYVYEASRRAENIPPLLANAFLIVPLQSLVLSLIGSGVLVVVLATYPEPVILSAVVFLILYLPLNLLIRYLNALNQGSRRFLRFNSVRLSVPVSYVLALLALLALGRTTVEGFVAAAVISNVCGLGVGLILARELWTRRVRPNGSLFVRTVSYGARAHLGNLAPSETLQFDLLLVATILGATDAGLYAVALVMSTVIRTEGIAVGMVTLPVLGASTNLERQGEALGRLMRFTFFVSAATALTFALFAEPLIGFVYGSAFGAAAPASRILAVAAVAAASRRVLGDALRGMGHPVQATLGEVATWLVAAPVFALLLPSSGMVGAAVSAATAYLASLVGLAYFAGRDGLSVARLFAPQREDLSVIVSWVRTVRRTM